MAKPTLAHKPKAAKTFVESSKISQKKPLVRIPDQDEESGSDDDGEAERSQDEEEDEDGDVEMGEDEDDQFEDEDQEPEQIGEDELELERLVFGDSAGFRENLKGFKEDKARRKEGPDDALEDGETGLEGVDDDDVSPIFGMSMIDGRLYG
jgi:hypothetical protein